MSDRVRSPAVAGAFYPARREDLQRALDECFRGPRGPGDWPHARADGRPGLRALIVPHAGYEYSGPIAARAYRVLGEAAPPKEILLLGVDHHGDGAPFALSGRPWESPLGRTEVAEELVRRLEGGPIERDESAHREEHSLEVQLPFLTAVAPGVPLAMLSVRHGSLESLREVARRVARAVQDRPALLIASTDFSHYVPAEVAREKDHRALAAILRTDGPGLYEVVERDRISMCGVAPTTVLLLALAAEGLRPTSLGWGHSGEAAPMPTVVGYAAVRFDVPEPAPASAARQRSST